jgi:signal transduction histidine kinase
MRLAEFILQNPEPILAGWEKFARTILPATRNMSQDQLRDHARAMLTTIARDMETAQSAAEQEQKSQGRRARGAQEKDTPAEDHAGDRLDSEFTLDELVSEYRALRASVVRLWTQNMVKADRSNLDELTRFNEAIDEALAESVARFTSRVERARDLLLGALGHDLRTPLSAVLHSAQFLLHAESLEGSHVKAVSRIVDSGTRMERMVADLLDFACTRLGRQLPILLRPMDIGAACRGTIEEIGAFYPERKFLFESTGELSGCWDMGRIGQMLSNLVGNAVEHGFAYGPILVRADGSEQDVLISVHNEGPAIPEDEQRQIFEPFQRGKADARPARTGQSLGLGLYIACEIAKAHHGTIEVISSDQAGTTFVVRLPRTLVPPERPVDIT